MNKHWKSAEENRSEKLKLLAQLLNDRLSGEYGRLASALTDDVVYRVVGDRLTCPFAGTAVGIRAMLDAIRRIDVHFEFLDMEDRTCIVDGDNVAIRWTGRWRNRGSGNSVDLEGFAHLVFEGDLVKEYTTFLDTAGLARLADWP